MGYGYSGLNLFTPAIGEEAWKKVYREFSLKVWMLILLSFGVMLTVFIITYKIIFGHSSDSEYTDLVLKLWGYFLTNSSQTLIAKRKLRYLLICWIWFTFFIGNFYNTAFYSLITGEVKASRQIDVEHLNTLPYKPCISETIRTYFLFAYNATLPEGPRIPECHYTPAALDFVAKRDDLYTIDMKYTYALREDHFIDSEGNHKLDVWGFAGHTVTVMYLNRGFPLRERIRVIANRLFESGILDNHLDKIYQRIHLVTKKHTKKFKKFRMTDLRIHFSVLLLGSVISFICFILEFLSERQYTKPYLD